MQINRTAQVQRSSRKYLGLRSLLLVSKLCLGLLLALHLIGCEREGNSAPGGEGSPGVGRDGEAALDVLRSDPRIQVLLTGCPQQSLYDVEIGQSSVLMQRLVDKLVSGQLEVLKRAKNELALIGAPVVPLLRRLMEEHYSNAFHSGYLENALGAASLMKDPAGRELLLLGFDHPQESVRAVAVTGLRLFHALPEDFDRLLERLEAPEGVQMRTNLAQALFLSDRARAEELVLGWLEKSQEQSLWLNTVPELCQTESDAVRARCATLVSIQSNPEIAEWLAAAGAAGGNEDCQRLLKERLEGGAWNQRLSVCEAIAKAGWIDPLVDVALDDPNSSVVLVAADHVAEAPGWNKERRDALATLLDSADPQVRSQMLLRLVEHGDSEAIDRAIAQLQEDLPEPMQAALLALKTPMQTDADLRERVRLSLEERNNREVGAPLQDRRKTIKAIGLLPLAWSVDTLIDIAHAYPGERLEGLRAHEWIMIHAGNTGDAGRARLFKHLSEESDPVRRLDMIRAISSARTDTARELLLQLAETGADSELELLYVADRVARVGPSHLVAPRLKRVLFSVETLEVRRALSCLMWYWY